MNSLKELNRKFQMYDPVVKHENRFIKVIDYKTKTDGRDGIYTVVERNDAAVMIVENSAEEVLLVKSYRYPAQDNFWELPMGGIENNESPLDAAKRELWEETGCEAELNQVGDFWPIPGLTPQKVYVFHSRITDEDADRILRFREATDELLDWMFVSKADLNSMIKNGEFQEGISLASLKVWM